MKSLKSSILEAYLPFTFEEFEEFLKDELYDAWEGEVWDKMIQAYGEGKTRIFCSWCSAYPIFKNRGIDAKKMYQLLQDLKDSRLKRILGAGGYGLAYDLPGNKIIKFNYRDELFPEDLKFYKYCQEYQPAVFPKIYKIGSNWVVMEKVKTDTPRVKLITEYQWKYYSKPLIALPPEMREIRKFVEEVKEHLDNFMSVSDWKDTGGEDIESRNCGERADGQLVCFDPINPNK